MKSATFGGKSSGKLVLVLEIESPAENYLNCALSIINSVYDSHKLTFDRLVFLANGSAKKFPRSLNTYREMMRSMFERNELKPFHVFVIQ